MTLEMILVGLIVVAALILFGFEVFPVDKVSLLILGALAGLGLLSPQEAVAGFGNPATITVGCMLALSFGIERSGALNLVANKIVDLSAGSEVRVLISIMLAVGCLSAFINNTAAVALFLPLCLAVAREQNLDPSRLLMPMSFTAIFAGTCTLIGTSTNLLVDGLLRERIGYSVGMFEVTGLGLIFFAFGTLYLLVAGRRLIPLRRGRENLTGMYQIKNFVTEVILKEGSPLIGKSLSEARLGERYHLEVIEIWRQKEKFLAAREDLQLQQGDILLVQGDPKALLQIQREQEVVLKAMTVDDRDLEDENLVLVEAFISRASRLVERTIKGVNFRATYNANALAIRHHGTAIREGIGTTRLRAGDSLLVLTARDNLEVLRDLPDFLVLEEVRVTSLNRAQALYSSVIFLSMIVVVALELITVLQAALVAVALMLLSGSLRLRELYANMSWSTLIMLGCLIPLGTAIEKTGLAALVADQVVGNLWFLGPVAVLSGIYLMTSILTEILSNNASAVLMIPIALAAAERLDASPLPFAFAIMFAASASFMTPVGYQTNTMIFAPGGYQFSDFIKVGTPLNLMFWLLATILIPWFWPF